MKLCQLEDSRRTFEIEVRAMGVEQIWLQRSAQKPSGYTFREVDRLWETWRAALVYANSQRKELER